MEVLCRGFGFEIVSPERYKYLVEGDIPEEG